MVIGHDVKVTILGIKGGQTRLGIDAPKTVPVDREEIHERKLRERRANLSKPNDP